jgi:integrase
VIYANPAATLKRTAIRAKEIALPSTDKFNALLSEMRAAHSRDSHNCADFVLGLAVTGMRKGEANALEWRDVDFEAGEIVVRGDPETATKNWELRRVPLIPDARGLFERMRSERSDESFNAKVFRVRESQKALDRACKKVGTDRITHHDLRHLFATRCIESGVDVPTVSRWLGHKDGGAARDENIRPPAPRAQHCTGATRDLRACRNKATRSDRVPGNGMIPGERRRCEKSSFFSLTVTLARVTPIPGKAGRAFHI